MLIDTFAKLSGHTKQDYITERLLCRDVVVQGNPRVYKALRDQLAAVLQELKRIEDNSEVNDVLLETIQMIAKIMDGMKEEFDGLLYPGCYLFVGAPKAVKEFIDGILETFKKQEKDIMYEPIPADKPLPQKKPKSKDYER